MQWQQLSAHRTLDQPRLASPLHLESTTARSGQACPRRPDSRCDFQVTRRSIVPEASRRVHRHATGLLFLLCRSPVHHRIQELDVFLSLRLGNEPEGGAKPARKPCKMPMSTAANPRVETEQRRYPLTEFFIGTGFSKVVRALVGSEFERGLGNRIHPEHLPTNSSPLRTTCLSLINRQNNERRFRAVSRTPQQLERRLREMANISPTRSHSRSGG